MTKALSHGKAEVVNQKLASLTFKFNGGVTDYRLHDEHQFFSFYLNLDSERFIAVHY